MSQRSERRGNLEVRLHDDGSLDEIVIRDKEGKCVFHLEAMSETCFWMRAYGDETDLVANIFAQMGQRETEEHDGTMEEGPVVEGTHEWEPKA